jgi:signal transduction histidine kinase
MDVCAVITNEVLGLEASARRHGITFDVHQCETTCSASTGTAGSGLGLALAKRFAEEQGGSIEVLSADGAGAQFVVKLPGTISLL